jgi:nucleolar protein 12
MDATAPNTNAYVVYSTSTAARAACTKLNGTVVLARHLRVDSVSHPAPQDSKRCVFVGNIAFTAIQSTLPLSTSDSKPDKDSTKKSKSKGPEDPEEGLWQAFSTCGTVESVRVIRDAKTRIGKGFAYVQFTDVNAVEKALLLDGQKFAPLLPRKLRVTRARRTKKRETGGVKGGRNDEERSLSGRAARMLGKGGAREVRDKLKEMRGKRPDRKGENDSNGVLEGLRASMHHGNRGLKFGKKKKSSKLSSRSARRAAAFRREKTKQT